MKSTLALSTLLLFGAGAATVGAQLNLRGSDTLEDITRNMIRDFCPGAGGPSAIRYIGGGSTVGEEAMAGLGAFSTGPAQQVAPMSRALGNRVCTAQQGGVNPAQGPALAENLFVALDGLSVTGNAALCTGNCRVGFSSSVAVTDRNGVAGLDCPGCSGASYTFSNWRDVLRVIYFGIHNNNGKDCNSDVRHSIAATWGSLFQEACANSASCTQLEHAWRRADFSGTTDTFISLLSDPAGTPNRVTVPAIDLAANANPFCNRDGETVSAPFGSDALDRDPIRRTCVGDGAPGTAGHSVCGWNLDSMGRRRGSLGLVQVINPPENAPPLTDVDIYPTAVCELGLFQRKDVQGSVTVCPDGRPVVGGRCWAPYRRVNGNPDFNCHNPRGNRAPNQGSFEDGRVYNKMLRRPGRFTGNQPALDGQGRPIIGAFYRIHSVTAPATAVAGTQPCRGTTATVQIGCLSAASRCSVGFAGLEGAGQPGACALPVNGVAATKANIQNLVLGTTPVYPLSRKLYFNTIKGFENVTGAELELSRCFATASSAKSAAESAGFIEAPAGPRCEDFSNSACAEATNACANNPAGFPTN